MGQTTEQRWDLAYPKQAPIVMSPAGHALAKKLRMTGRVDVAVDPARKEGRPASCSHGALTIALVCVVDEAGEYRLTITHRASGFALFQAVARPGVYRGYYLPATAAGLKAAVAAARALEQAEASLGAAWSEPHPFAVLLTIEDKFDQKIAGRKFGEAMAAVTFPHLEAVLDAQDRTDMAAKRRELMSKDRAEVAARVAEHAAKGWAPYGATKTGNSRGHAGWVELVVRGEFWWQAGKMWAADARELAERDRRLNGHG